MASEEHHPMTRYVWLLYRPRLVEICLMSKKTQETAGKLLCRSRNERRGEDRSARALSNLLLISFKVHTQLRITQ